MLGWSGLVSPAFLVLPAVKLAQRSPFLRHKPWPLVLATVGTRTSRRSRAAAKFTPRAAPSATLRGRSGSTPSRSGGISLISWPRGPGSNRTTRQLSKLMSLPHASLCRLAGRRIPLRVCTDRIPVCSLSCGKLRRISIRRRASQNERYQYDLAQRTRRGLGSPVMTHLPGSGGCVGSSKGMQRIVTLRSFFTCSSTSRLPFQ